MCTRPITKDRHTFACRTCDECISTRRSGWVARAMAEKAEHPHTYSITLTYSEDTQESRDGARFFCYADVQAFFKRLRSAARYEAKRSGSPIVPYIRFLCAGEQGDRFNRVHWHIIIYSNFDLARIGSFRRSGVLVSHRADMISVGKKRKRLNWTLWPHGFMLMQEPDQGGMNYVLSYCLKDQFTAEKSQGTMRETKVENFATGLFRMSKRPAIGERWLIRKMEALDASGAVLPSLNIKVPDMSGYWQPGGSFRKKVLWHLVALNKRHQWTYGRNAPQWSTLLANCADNEADMEILVGKEEESETDAEFAARIALRSREIARASSDRERATKCGAAIPCEDCCDHLSREVLRSIGLERYESDEGHWHYEPISGVANPVGYAGGVNPFCQQKGSKASRLTFSKSDT